MEVLVKENGRLVAENNQLHVDVMSAAESAQKRDREHYQSSKALECQIAELAYWKNCTLKKVKELEAENQGLRTKLQDLLKTGVHEPGAMDLSESLDLESRTQAETENQSEENQSQNTINLDIMKSADARFRAKLLLYQSCSLFRITDLERKTAELQQENDVLREETVRLLVRRLCQC